MTSATYTIMDDNTGKYATGSQIQGNSVEWLDETGAETQSWDMILSDAESHKWNLTKITNSGSELYAWCMKPVAEGYKVEVSPGSRNWFVVMTGSDTGYIQTENDEMFWQSPSVRANNSGVVLGSEKPTFIIIKKE